MASALIRNMPRPGHAPTSYLEMVLLTEIARALQHDDVRTLAALDRLRDAAGLHEDPRVRMRLLKTEKPHVRS